MKLRRTTLGLLQAGNDQQARDSLSADEGTLWKERLWDGSTWLHVAADAACIETCRWLLEQGVDVDDVGLGTVTPQHSMTPLSLAAGAGAIRIVQALIDAGASIEGAALELASPLTVACIEGHLEIARLLVASGAEINRIHARWDKTPLDIARDRGHVEIVGMLRERGGVSHRAADGWTADTPGLRIIEELEAQVGPVSPMSLARIVPGVADRSVRIASIDKAPEYRLIFTTSLVDSVAGEIALCLPRAWPLNSVALRKAEYSWPISMALRIADAVGSRSLRAGHVLEIDDAVFAGLPAPFSRIILVDRVQVAGASLLMVVPLSKSAKVTGVEQVASLLAKSRTLPWPKLAISSI